MTHGLPDFYRGVDIAYQALSEMIVRPKYGACQLANGSKVVAASVETDLVTVSGKGIIYGGLIWLHPAASQKTSTPRLYVDGTLVFHVSFSNQKVYGFDFAPIRPLFLQKYDDTNFYYVSGLGYGITFETSIKLAYFEAPGATPTVYHDLQYAVI